MSRVLETMRKYANHVFNDNGTCLGKTASWIVSLAVFFMCIMILLETMPTYQNGDPASILVVLVINAICFAILAIDLIGRCIAVWDRYFFLRIRTWIDIVSTIAYFLWFILPPSAWIVVVPIQSLRILTMFRVRRSSKDIIDMEILVRAVHIAMRPLGMVLLLIFYLVFISATFVYYTDTGYWNKQDSLRYRVDPVSGEVSISPFQSVYGTMWFSFETWTTVGYGDATPVYPVAKVFACLTMLAGILITSLVVGFIASSAFTASEEQLKFARSQTMAGGNIQDNTDMDVNQASSDHAVLFLPDSSLSEKTGKVDDSAFVHFANSVSSASPY